MSKTIILIDSIIDNAKAAVAHVVVQCSGDKARITKDRSNGYFFEVEKLNALIPVLEAIYPGYEIEDLRSAA